MNLNKAQDIGSSSLTNKLKNKSQRDSSMAANPTPLDPARNHSNEIKFDNIHTSAMHKTVAATNKKK